MNLHAFARRAALALVLLGGMFWIAPSAFAGVHVGVGVGVYGPGYAVGINSGCWRCGYYGYAAPPAYYPAPAYPAPVYYLPAYRYYPAPVYYGPAWYGYRYYAPRYPRYGRRGGYYYGRGHGYGSRGGYHHHGRR